MFISAFQRDKTRVQAVTRAIQVLRVISAAESALGLADISRLTGLNKTIVYRLVNTLNDAGLVKAGSRRGSYDIGPAAFALGVSYLRSSGILDAARPVLTRLRHDVDLPAFMAVMDGGEVFFVSLVDSLTTLPLPTRLGASLPVRTTAVGKILLAGLSDPTLIELLHKVNAAHDLDVFRSDLMIIRNQGYVVEEHDEATGSVAFAAPVVGKDSSVVAAVAIACPDPAIALNGRKNSLVESVRNAGQTISKAFAHV